MTGLDWSQCSAVESIHGKVSGARVSKGTRMPLQVVFEHLEAGMPVEEIMRIFDVTQEQLKAVLHFVGEGLAKEPVSGYSSFEVLNRTNRKAAIVHRFALLGAVLCWYAFHRVEGSKGSLRVIQMSGAGLFTLLAFLCLFV